MITLYYVSSEVVRCPDLDDPPYGSVNQTDSTPGSTAHYECDDGFKLVGDEYRECLKTGYWDGEEPICKSNDACFSLCRGYVNMCQFYPFACRNYLVP